MASDRCHIEERNALLQTSSRNAEKAPTVGGGEPAISLGKVRGDREGGTIALIGEGK
jgi:hypothetical protein